MSAIDNLKTEFEKHPLLIVLAVLGVIVAALLSRKSAPSDQQYSFAGGGQAAPVDPEAAAIEEARIQAGTQNVGILASLLGTEDTNRTALTGALAQTGAQRDVALSQISAQRDVGLAETAAAEEVANYQATVGLEGLQNTNASAISAANITAGTQRAIADANLQRDLAVNASAEKTALYQLEVNKAIARGEDNTSIVHGLLTFGEQALAFFGL